MLLPITSSTIVYLNTFLSIFLIAGISTIAIEQALVLFKSLKND